MVHRLDSSLTDEWRKMLDCIRLGAAIGGRSQVECVCDAMTRDKPVANTSLVEWNGKLWALWEAHRPYVLDPDTLETHGEETLGAPAGLACNVTYSAAGCPNGSVHQ